ncbi:phosphate signaling complex protein PhoU [bacterium]|nr:phosphate signaling complex protein PhoU [bacterium]
MSASEGPRISYRGHLDELRNTVLRMGTFAEEMLIRAMTALVNQDVALAREVHRSDDVADDLDFEIDRKCTSLLASQQPMAGDLRDILGALKIATDLERIADYAKDIAKVAIAVGEERWFKPLADIQRMGEVAVEQLRQALRAFADHDLDLARDVARGDEQLDDLWHGLWAELPERMQAEPAVVPQAMRLVLVARYLERIGDHTVNVMERLQYMDTGRREALTD